MHTTYQKKQYEIRVFSRMRFSCQKPRMLWVFLAVQQKTQFFFILGFANVNGPIYGKREKSSVEHIMKFVFVSNVV